MRKIALAMAALLIMGNVDRDALIGPWPVRDPTTVTVLGSPHLSGIPQLQDLWLEPVLRRLADWDPRIITIEALSGPECRLLRLYEGNWRGTADGYCKRVEALAALGRAATGLDMPAAEAAAEKAVGTATPASAPAAHRRMAALFAAAGNIGSAATQWLRLPPAERRAQDGIDAALVRALDDLVVLRNENYLIAATLAARLGLERVYPVDDHLSDRITKESPSGFAEAMRDIWSGTPPPLVARGMAMEKALDGRDATFAYYRYLNRADVGEAYVRADQGKAFATPSPEHHGRRYMAWWEARNLRMVANIRAALASQPGARALVVVGATHKPYIEAYLRQMHEVRITPVQAVIGK